MKKNTAFTGMEGRVYTPLHGFWSSVERHLIPNNAFSEDSLDWMMSLSDLKATRRRGTLLGETKDDCLRTPDSAIDVTLGGGTPRARGRVSELRNRNLGYISPTVSVGADPQPMVMLTEDRPDINRSYGTIFHLPFNNADPYENSIPGALIAGGVVNSGAATLSAYALTSEPWPYVGGGRFVANTDKWSFGAGGRNFVETERWLALSKLRGVPGRWNKEWYSALGVPKERILPTGKIPPSWRLTKTEHAAAGSWPIGGKFYYTVFFEDEDGTYGPMLQVRPPGTGTIHGATGYGYYTLTNTCDYIDWSDIPIGPVGTRRRHLCRSLVVTAAGLPDPTTIGLVHTIDDNTTTTYRDFYGNDEAVEPFPEGIRQDYIWQPQCRYQWSFDQRFACGYTRPNIGAILLYPYHPDGAGSYLNYDFTGASFQAAAAANDAVVGNATYAYYVKKSGSTLTLYLWNGSFANPSTGHWGETLTLTGLTLQDVVDYINARIGWGLGGAAPWASVKVSGTVAGYPGTTFRWYAQLAPGADGSALATELADTTAYPDWGDSYETGATNFQNMRAWGPFLPAILTMSSTWSDRYQTQRNTVYFTGGGPGHAPYGIASWYVENFRSLPSDIGDCVGGAPLLDGCLVLCTRGVGVLRNIRDGKTGVDDDYRLEQISGVAGCIAPESIISLNGAVGYLSRDGYIIADGERFVSISGAVYNPGSRRGVWANEIALCETACMQDDDDATFSASIIDSRLWVSYRSNGATRRLMAYDFSGSKANSGVAQFLDENGNPFPWSCPLTTDIGVPGSYRTASGLIHIGVRMPSANTLQLIEFHRSTYVDSVWNSGSGAYVDTAITATGYLKMDNLGTDLKKSLRELRVRYRKEAAGLSVKVTRKVDRASTQTMALAASTAGHPYTRKRFEAPLVTRTPADIVELAVYDDGTGNVSSDFFDIEATFDILSSLY